MQNKVFSNVANATLTMVQKALKCKAKVDLREKKYIYWFLPVRSVLLGPFVHVRALTSSQPIPKNKIKNILELKIVL